jgi:hypothetical protein
VIQLELGPKLSSRPWSTIRFMKSVAFSLLCTLSGFWPLLGKSGATDVANPSQAFCELSRRDGAIVTWHRSAWDSATPEKAVPEGTECGYLADTVHYDEK